MQISWSPFLPTRFLSIFPNIFILGSPANQYGLVSPNGVSDISLLLHFTFSTFLSGSIQTPTYYVLSHIFPAFCHFALCSAKPVRCWPLSADMQLLQGIRGQTSLAKNTDPIAWRWAMAIWCGQSMWMGIWMWMWMWIYGDQLTQIDGQKPKSHLDDTSVG